MINDLVNTGLQPAVTAKVSPIVTEKPVAVAKPAATATPVELEEPESASPESQAAPSTDDVQRAVSQLNDYVQTIKRTLSFSISETTGRTIIQVYDSETDELIRQIPPDQTIELAAKLDDIAAGFFVKERA
jgi:flagellar protein FlaG